MVDRITTEQRSKNMSAVKGKGNKSTEEKILVLLKENRITGWRRHIKTLPGKPDFSFRKEKVALFVNGCFWHGCPKCYSAPKTNIEFWIKKIESNVQRDQKNRILLKKKGWRVVTIWEHEIKAKSFLPVKKIIRSLNTP